MSARLEAMNDRVLSAFDPNPGANVPGFLFSADANARGAARAIYNERDE